MALGTLTIDIAANLARLESDLGKANRLAEKFAQDQAKRYQAIGKVIGTAVAGLATGAFAGWIKESIDAADNASKAAASIGISIEAYQGLSFAAELGGVAQEQLNGALTKFNKVISEAGAGGKKQAQAFADLGVSIRDSSGQLKTADALMLDVADKFAQYENGASKAAIAQELFGKSGAKLIPTLNSGRDGITQLMEQAQRLGLIMSQETANNAEIFNDQLTVLEAITRGVANQIAAEMLPSLQEMAGLMIDVGEDSGVAATAADVLGGTLKGLATGAIIVAQTFANTGRAIGGFAAAASALAGGELDQASAILDMMQSDNADATAAAIERINKLWGGDFQEAGAQAGATAGVLRQQLERTNKETEAGAAAAAKATDAIQQQIEALQLQAATVGKTADEVTLFKLAQDGATESQLKAARAALDAVAAYEASQKAAADSAERWKAAANVISSTYTDLSRDFAEYQTQVETLRAALNGGEINQTAYDEAVSGLDQKLNETIAKAGEAKNELTVFADEAARSMQGALADFFFDPFKDGVEGMVQNFGKAMQRMIAEAAAAQVMKQVFGAVTASGSREGGLLAGLGAAIFGGGKAVGGPAEAGKLYEVGENNAAELFMSNGRQYLIPGNSGSVKPLAGGGGTTQVFNISTPNADSFRASQRQIARKAKQNMGRV